MSMSSGLFSLGDDDPTASDKPPPPSITPQEDFRAPSKNQELRSVYFKRGGGERDSTAGAPSTAPASSNDEGIYLDLYGNKKSGSGKSKSSPLLTLKQKDSDRDETCFNDDDQPSGSSSGSGGSRFGSPAKFFSRSSGKSSLKGSPSKSSKKSPSKGKLGRQHQQHHQQLQQQPQASPPHERPKFELSPPTSPVNSSGVEIVIEPGTDSSQSMSPPVVDPDTQIANCDYLTVDHAFSNDSNSKCDSTNSSSSSTAANNSTSATASQVHLLSEMDR